MRFQSRWDDCGPLFLQQGEVTRAGVAVDGTTPL